MAVYQRGTHTTVIEPIEDLCKFLAKVNVGIRCGMITPLQGKRIAAQVKFKLTMRQSSILVVCTTKMTVQEIDVYFGANNKQDLIVSLARWVRNNNYELRFGKPQ